MRRYRPAVTKFQVPLKPSTANRRRGIMALVALAGLLCSGAGSPTGCQESSGSIGPTKGQVIGVAVGIGAVIAAVVLVSVNVHHSHHTLNGCVSSGPNGLELRTSDAKTYQLDGSAATIKAGDHVKLQGSRAKKTKDSSGDQIFRVEKLSRDFGPCVATSAMPAPSNM